MNILRAGSRESRLAVVQTELVMEAIRQSDPSLQLELVTMKTTGDKILDRTLDQVGGKGLFVKELDTALLEGRVDFTVHSCKDLPMDLDPRLPLAGFSRRADPRDALVLPEGVTELDPSKPIGCASARRTLQLRRLFPGQPVAPVRGNVQTRLRKLDEGQYAALVLAAAGLKRLGLLDDEQYGRQYIDAYREKRSRKRLCRDLQQKGLSPELIRRLLEEEPVDEDRQIRAFLQKKGYDRETWTRQEKGKLAAALARKGFSWEAVYRMLGGDGEDGDF